MSNFAVEECCDVDSAWLAALRSLDCTPIKSENHFVLIRPETSGVPYAVVSTSITQGIRTSDFVEQVHSTRISGYFSKDKMAEAHVWSSLLTDFLFSTGCLSLGNCGCFCVRSIGSTAVSVTSEFVFVSVTVTGRFNAASGSGSAFD